jgi:hypothetical protein
MKLFGAVHMFGYLSSDTFLYIFMYHRGIYKHSSLKLNIKLKNMKLGLHCIKTRPERINVKPVCQKTSRNTTRNFGQIKDRVAWMCYAWMTVEFLTSARMERSSKRSVQNRVGRGWTHIQEECCGRTHNSGEDFIIRRPMSLFFSF